MNPIRNHLESSGSSFSNGSKLQIFQRIVPIFDVLKCLVLMLPLVYKTLHSQYDYETVLVEMSNTISGGVSGSPESEAAD